MPRTSKKASKSPIKASAKSKKPRAVRGSVRTVMLEMLSTGPKTRAQLLKAGGFSGPSLYLNLAKLKEENLIEIEGRGGPVRLKASTKSSVTKSKPTVTASEVVRSTAVAVIAPQQFVPGPLQDALESVAKRFSIPDRLGEKLHTLEQLAKSLPSPIAETLLEIRSDLAANAAGR